MAGKTILVVAVYLYGYYHMCVYVLEYLYAPEVRDSERLQQGAQKALDEFSIRT